MTIATTNLFTTDELDSILLGLAWAMDDEEPTIAVAAATATEKMAGLLPEPADELVACPAPDADDPTGGYWVPFLESACAAERKLTLVYRDKVGNGTSRVVWPLMVDTWREPEALVAWCETRRDFRVFRVDRIQSLSPLDRYPTRRQVLIAKWQMQQDEE